MSFWRIAWRSIQQRSLASVLTALSMALGVALMVAVIVVGGSAGESFMSNAGNGYNLIVGGKGGSLQLTLNTVYRISKPLEPVPYTYYKEFLPASKRKDGQDGQYAAYVAKAVPVCLGDYYDEFRVVGTTPEYFEPLPGGREYKFADGKPYKQSDFFGAVIGSAVARKLEIGLKSKIQPTHSAEDGHVHDEKFVVRGVLAPMGNADDRSVFINLEGFYLLEGHAKPEKKTATANKAASAKASSEPKVDEHAHEHGSEPHHHEHHEDANDGHKHEHGEDGHEHAPARADAKESSASERAGGDHDHEDHAHEHDHAEKGNAKADEHQHDEHEHDHAHGDENPAEAVATEDHDHHHDHAEQGKSGAAKSASAEHGHAAGDDHAHEHEEHAHADEEAAASAEKDGHDHDHAHDEEVKAANSKSADVTGPDHKHAEGDDHAHDHEDHAHGEQEHAHEHPTKSSHDHKGHDHSHDGHDHSHDGHDHHGHDHGQSHEPLPESAREVTAFLVRTSDIMFSEALAQEINEGTVAQAVSPIGEITRLFSTFVGPMERILYVLTALIIVVAATSIMVGMYNSMNERKHEIAVMRALGASRGAVGSIVLMESILLSLLGGVLGWVLGHILVGAISPYVQEYTGIYLGFFRFVPKYELILIPALVALASLVGYLPAVAAYRTDVAKSLTANP